MLDSALWFFLNLDLAKNVVVVETMTLFRVLLRQRPQALAT
jgi:hypothetical protein